MRLRGHELADLLWHDFFDGGTMRKYFLGLATSSLLLTNALQAAEPISLEAFASPQQMRLPDISPDGRHIVFIDQDLAHSRIAVMDLSSGQTSQLLPGESGEFSVSLCRFKNNSRLVCYFHGITPLGGLPLIVTRVIGINIDRSEFKVLNQRQDDLRQPELIIDLLKDDARNILIQEREENELYPAVFKLDVYTAQRTRVVKASAPVMFWRTDRTGFVRFGFGYADANAVYKTRNSDSEPWRMLKRAEAFDGGEFHVFGFGASSDKLVVSAPKNGHIAVWELDLTDTADRQLLFSVPDVDVDGPVLWPADSRLVGFHYQAEKPQIQLFDEQARFIQLSIDTFLPNSINRVYSSSHDGQRLIVASESDRQPKQYFLLDLQAKKMQRLRLNGPLLTYERLAEMKPVVVPAADGAKIPGYLTLPPGAAPVKLPAVVLPHGGPFGRDGWGFDPVVQMLASRGFAVLQLNYRGTSGYGIDWMQAGYAKGGSVMLGDVTAGTNWLVTQGLADPQRICLMGWAFGGYAAMLGGINTSSLYRCIVSIGGISEPTEYDWGWRRFFYGIQVGQATKSDDREFERSPLKAAAKLRLPVLLIHGTWDTVVNIEQSQWMGKALERSGNSPKLVVVEHGDDALSKPQMRLLLLRELEQFLGMHLAPH